MKRVYRMTERIYKVFGETHQSWVEREDCARILYRGHGRSVSLKMSGCVFSFLVATACGTNAGGKPDLGLERDVREAEYETGADTRIEGEFTGDNDGERLSDAGEAGGAPQCSMVRQGVLLPVGETTLFALSLFHYNVQYVAGGLKGFLGRPEFDGLGDEEVQDLIVLESFAPLLTVLEQHPTWGFDVEMQGYMLDIMRERHPDVVERMRTLVERGQLHVDSFHYSDQLWTAHPIISMEKSWEMNEEAFRRACLPMGGAVFTQEGQFGRGMAAHLAGTGRIALLPRNLWKYYRGDVPTKLMYNLEGTPVVVTKGTKEQVDGRSVEIRWIFVNDGELALTGNANPYFGPLFAYNEKEAAKFVHKIEEMEAEGWKITTIRDFASHMEAWGYEPEDLPQVLDGSWQPQESGNMFRWMGGKGAFSETEDDNGVLTGLVQSRMLLQAAGVVATKTAGAGQDLVNDGWVNQVLGEVSDSTGWNPWEGEVAYSKEHAAKARAAAMQVLSQSRNEGGTLFVDTRSGEVSTTLPADAWLVYDLTQEEVVVIANEISLDVGPIEVETSAPGWEVSVKWSSLPTVPFNSGNPGQAAWIVKVKLIPGPNPEGHVQVVFPRFDDILWYVPALLEYRGEKSLEGFEPSSFPLDESKTLNLPLANGLLGLGGENWLVKLTPTVHLAVRIPAEEENVRFECEALPRDSSHEWIFLFLQSVPAPDAMETANRVNVHPVVKVMTTHH